MTKTGRKGAAARKHSKREEKRNKREERNQQKPAQSAA
jgi:hypothetical protein